MPFDHPIKRTLDFIFSQSRATENEQSLIDAGFTVLTKGPFSFVIIAKHPLLPHYIFKLYLDSETQTKKETPHWKWLLKRCIGAEKIRNLIHKKNIRHFTVPDKWLYLLPSYPFSKEKKQEPFILVETDMKLRDAKATKKAWKTYVTRKHLEELYMILKHGYGSIHLLTNVPYTNSRQFAFIDTENIQKHLDLKKVKKHLSEEMQLYWDSLINF